MNFFIDAVLYSYAQIFFSNRRWFGAVALASTFMIPKLGLMGLLGVVLCNFIAYILKFDNDKIKSGFYGFNGILFGAAVVYYFELNIFLVLLLPVFIMLTFFISAVLEHHLAESFNLPGLSLPFVISIFVFIVFLTNYNDIKTVHLTETSFPFISTFPDIVRNYFRTLSLILFQPNTLSGILLAVGLLFFSRVLLVLSIVSYLITLFFLNLILPQHYNNVIILYTFNAVLTAFALGGSLIIPSRKSFLLVLISSLIVVIITGTFFKFLSGTHFPVLVLPFNFIVLSVIYSLKFRKDQTGLVLLYFKPGSPEENFYYHQKRKLRFDRFKFLYPELPVFGEWKISQSFNGKHTHKQDFRYAWDLVVVDEKGKQYSGSGDNLKDYYCFNLPVISPLGGEVVKVVDGIPDNEINDINIKENWGNTVIIKNEYGLFTSISHLEANTIKVKEGDWIKKGDILGNCGSSGRSPCPHIHIQYQATDKLGEKTFKFPFAHYMVKEDGKFLLKSFDYPKENEIVSNIDSHKIIKKAFAFKLGEKVKFNCTIGESKCEEEWEVKINMLNEFYIESSAGSSASFFITDKIFYFNSFTGKRKSALYYFYLAAMQVPLCYQQNLIWEDVYSIDQLPGNSIRYINEFFLFFGNLITAKGLFRYLEVPEENSNYIIANKIFVKGSGLFSGFSKELDTRILVDPEGEIGTFSVIEGSKMSFNATRIKEEEE